MKPPIKHFGEKISFLARYGISVYVVAEGRRFKIETEEQLKTKTNYKRGQRIFYSQSDCERHIKNHVYDYWIDKIKSTL